MATVWRLQGIETHGGDLALTRLALWGEDGLLSDGAAVTASHAPVEGDLSTLAAGGPACLWPQEVVQSPGFWIEMTCLSDAEAWAARFMPVSVLSGVAHYSLTTLRSGRRVCAALGRVPATAGEWSVAPTRSAALDVWGGISIPSTPSGGSNGFYGAAMSRSGRVQVASGTGSSSAVCIISRDYGGTWSALSGPRAASNGFTTASVSDDGQIIVLAGRGDSGARVSVSEDGGYSWEIRAMPAGSVGFAFAKVSPDGTRLLAGTQGSSSNRLYVSSNLGGAFATITNASMGMSDSWGYANGDLSLDGRHMVAAVFSSEAFASGNAPLMTSSDWGETWSPLSGTVSGQNGFAGAAISYDGQIILGAGNGAAAKLNISRDGGLTWTHIGSDGMPSGFEHCGLSGDGVVGCAVLRDGSSGGAATRLLVTTNAGVIWTRYEVAPGPTGVIGCAVSRDGGWMLTVGAGGSASRVWRMQVADPVYLPALMPFRIASMVSSSVGNEGGMHTSRLSAVSQDMEFGGAGRIYGTVSRKATPSNAPLSRRVRLHRSVDGYLARETWSKTDGSYEFRELNPRYEYDVIAWDHELQEFSTVANNQLAEVAP